MIIFRGRGIVVAGIAVGCLLAAEAYTRMRFHNDNYYRRGGPEVRRIIRASRKAGPSTAFGAEARQTPLRMTAFFGDAQDGSLFGDTQDGSLFGDTQDGSLFGMRTSDSGHESIFTVGASAGGARYLVAFAAV